MSKNVKQMDSEDRLWVPVWYLAVPFVSSRFYQLIKPLGGFSLCSFWLTADGLFIVGYVCRLQRARSTLCFASYDCMVLVLSFMLSNEHPFREPSGAAVCFAAAVIAAVVRAVCIKYKVFRAVEELAAHVSVVGIFISLFVFLTTLFGL